MSQLTIDFLDVGPTKYGDCILIRGNGKTILIDGAHPGDMKDKEGFTSIPGQLDALFGTARPHAIDLLIVTHAHADHIGCLPALVEQGVLQCEMAYVADEALGWASAPDSLPSSSASSALAVLREEGALSLTPDSLDQALRDAGTLRENYSTLLGQLEQQGTLIRCTGSEDRAAIEQKFAGIGLRILGPTKEHLDVCHAQIEQFERDVLLGLQGAVTRDAASSAPDLIRDVALADDDGLLDQFGAGSALNNQSIVIALEFGGRKVLLPGDMQFAEHEVTGLDDEMTALRQVVKAHGPYDIVKTSHHTSYNGWSEAIGAEQLISSRAAYLVHSGGRNDTKHPEDGALSAIRKLKQHRSKPLTYLRTDRNGAINFTLSSSGAIAFAKSKGRVNDFRPNTDTAFSQSLLGASQTPSVPVVPRPVAPWPATGQDVVEVVARVPHVSTRVTLTIDVAPAAGRPQPVAPTAPVTSTATVAPGGPGRAGDPQAVTFSLPVDRALPPLLFLTDAKALAGKIGSASVDAMVNALTQAGQTILNVEAAGATPRQIADAVREHMAGVQGVVLIGDVDVLPSQRLDVLPPELRQALSDPEGDPDNFIVWNDEVYGCIDADDIPELPVSRIPDGGRASTIANALRSSGAGPAHFGIRNSARPFADVIFKEISKTAALKVSHPVKHTDIQSSDVAAGLVYMMLHGSDADTRRFWGETASAGPLEAFNVGAVPAATPGVVLAGCCWGALTASHKACDAAAGAALAGRTASESVAVAFVSAGVRAFIGCTGVHYSPPGASTKSAGAPMHRAVLDGLAKGQAPALALFNAKRTCLGQIHAAGSAEELAVGLKVIREFTCLGLGW